MVWTMEPQNLRVSLLREKKTETSSLGGEARELGMTRHRRGGMMKVSYGGLLPQEGG